MKTRELKIDQISIVKKGAITNLLGDNIQMKRVDTTNLFLGSIQMKKVDIMSLLAGVLKDKVLMNELKVDRAEVMNGVLKDHPCLNLIPLTNQSRDRLNLQNIMLLLLRKTRLL